jgi:hypothetical protein
MAKINFDGVRFWPFSQSPRAAGAARINCGDALRSATELMIDLKSCNSHSLSRCSHRGPKIYSRPRSLRFCAVEFNCGFTLCGLAHTHQLPLFYSQVVAVYFALRSWRAPAAIKLTNFCMLPYTLQAESILMGIYFIFPLARPLVRYSHKYGFPGHSFE